MTDQQAKDKSHHVAMKMEACKLAYAYRRQREARVEMIKIVKRWVCVYKKRHGISWLIQEDMTWQFRECLNKIISSVRRKGLHRFTPTAPNRIIKFMLDYAYGQI